MEENVITKPDLTKTGLSEAEETTDARPVRRKSARLRRLLEKRKHVLRKYESIEERLKTIDESIRQEEEREILEKGPKQTPANAAPIVVRPVVKTHSLYVKH